MSNFPPTDEQRAAIDIARTGTSCVIQALAGSGKTSTLRLIAEEMPARRFQFVAFNKAIVTDVQSSFPKNVACRTAHSLAFAAIGKQYSHRLGAGRMKGYEIARLLRIEPMVVEVLGTRKRLDAGFLGGIARRAIIRFCQTDEAAPTMQHVPVIPGIDEPSFAPSAPGVPPKMINRRGPNWHAVAAALEPALRRYWADVMNPAGTLPYDHGCYLKQYELSSPTIATDTILFDEGQDASPVMLSIVAQQAHAQLILVGDSYQSIYGFTGAIDALTNAIPDAPRTWLTRSFRFGPEIAEVANQVLADLDAPVRVEGAGRPGAVGPLGSPDTILFRTNARAVAVALQELRAGKRVALVGGADEVVNFAKAAQDLKAGRACYHPELSCFTSWDEVQAYVEVDPNGSDLKLLVALVDEFDADTIVAELQGCSSEARADLVLSTAHKSKGREWAAVALADDFPDPEAGNGVSDDDRRLLYVSVTRARTELDIDSVAYFTKAVS